MYYFKCGNCGYLNLVTSEYLIFCVNCGKKLQTTYRDWHLRNPDKNLNDFNELFCVRENEQKKSTSKKNKKKEYKKLLYLSLLTILVFLTLIYGTSLATHFFLSETEINNLKSEKWTAKKIGNISVETPFSLIDAGSIFHNNIVENFKSYAHTSSEGFEMLITSITYTKNIAEQNIPSTASDPINQMQLNNSISKLKFEKSNIRKNEALGILYKGSFLRDNEQFEFIDATYAEKSSLWQLIIVFKTEPKWDKYEAYRILNSLEISK